MNSFDYQRADSVEDAIAQLRRQGDDAKFLAGGHSLLPAMKYRLNSPSALIDLSGLDELKTISVVGDEILIGAMVTHRQVELSSDVMSKCPALAETAAGIGDPLVRNKGTIGGSLAHADPAADYPAIVLALSARIDVQGSAGARSIDADDFFTGMFETTLGEGELITRVVFSADRSGSGSAYAKFPNPASRFAVVGVAASISIENGACSSARIGVTGASPMAYRASKIEAALVGSSLDSAAINAACANTPDPDDLLSDLSASAEYRAHLVGVMAKKAIAKAVARAKG